MRGEFIILPFFCEFQVLDEISEHGIRIYQLPDADSDEDEEFKEQTRVLKASFTGVYIAAVVLQAYSMLEGTVFLYNMLKIQVFFQC